jgi:uncharacterized protein containing a von willebrand factor type A (VWA) domain
MLKRKAKILKTFLIMFLLITVNISIIRADVQKIKYNNLTHFNVGLVIDGSGSLGSTDPNKLRYDAIDLFLALLTNKGNNIDTVVFNDNKSGYAFHSGLMSVDGRESKLNLSNEIRNTPITGDTDIGGSLLEAVNTLKDASEQNGLKSVIILFSDGRSDLGNDEKAYKKSLENKETAIVAAQDANIPVYTICLNASEVADPAELREISTRTSGDTLEVKDASDLESAFESFYKLIFATSGLDRLDASYNEEGIFEYDFTVPSYGAEEVNIIIDSNGVGNIALTSPSGDVSSEDIENMSMSAGNVKVIKLVEPKSGSWKVVLNGSPSDKVTINVLYSMNVEGALETESNEYEVGKAAKVTAYLKNESGAIMDNAVTSEYKASIVVKNNETGAEESYEMSASTTDGTFMYELTAEKSSSYTVYAIFKSADIETKSNELNLNFGNTAPNIIETAKDIKDGVVTKSVVVTPFTGHKADFNLSNYFTDNQDGTNLIYRIASSQLVDKTAIIDNDKLNINTRKSKSGNVVVEAVDKEGAATPLTFHMKVTNLEYLIDTTTILILLAILIIIILAIVRHYNQVFYGDVEVKNISDNRGMASNVVSFRGKRKLRLYAVGECGFDVNKSYFFPTGGNKLMFISNTKFYYGNSKEPVNKVNVNGGRYTLYTDAAHTRGISIKVTPNNGNRNRSRSRQRNV